MSRTDRARDDHDDHEHDTRGGAGDGGRGSRPRSVGLIVAGLTVAIAGPPARAALRVRRMRRAAAAAPRLAVDIDLEHQRTIAHGLVGLAEGVSRRLVESDLSFDPDLLGRQVADLAWAGLRAVRR